MDAALLEQDNDTTNDLADSIISELLDTALSEPDDTVDILLKLDHLVRTTDVDLTRIHCSKSGQPIGIVTEQEIRNILNYHGVERLEDIAHELDLATCISRIWLHTGPANLDKLQACDPRGFFVYCMSVALQAQYMEFDKSGTKKFKSIEAQRSFRNSGVKAWYMLARIGDAELAEANKALRMFMYLNLHQKTFYRVPWYAMRLKVSMAQYKQYMRNWCNGKTNPSIATTFSHDNNPMMPHEFATPWGMLWIKTVLEKHVRDIRRQLAYNQEAYAHLQQASAFKPGGKYSDFYQLVQDIVGDSIGKTIESLSSLVARQRKMQGKQANAVVATKGMTLAINMSSNGSHTNPLGIKQLSASKPIVMPSFVKGPQS